MKGGTIVKDARLGKQGGSPTRPLRPHTFRLARHRKSPLFPRMIFPRRFFSHFLAGALALAPLGAFAAKARPARPAAESAPAFRGAITMDAATGNVLSEENADVVSPPASMTKLMTFAVLHDKLASGALSLDTPVRIAPEDAKIGGTQVFLDPRETFPVEELIYAMMIQSANDAAHALARASAGSVPVFVDLMNAKARELGMTHTTFRTPHGLPPTSRRIADGDLTTPRDFALLCRHLLTKTDVLKYTAVKTRDFGANRPQGPQHMENHNKLLGKIAGVDGLKTGYTAGAGYCLSATAERKGRRLIVVIMGSFGPNGQADKGKTRDLRTIDLIERGFAALPPGGPVFVARARSTPSAAGANSPISAAPLTNDEKKAADGPPLIKFNPPPTMQRK
jgi:D-alanyl-D-alanine carboxypeptidase (penicillin-binding protein 5/6)